jgi:hypothetical protein
MLNRKPCKGTNSHRPTFVDYVITVLFIVFGGSCCYDGDLFGWISISFVGGPEFNLLQTGGQYMYRLL